MDLLPSRGQRGSIRVGIRLESGGETEVEWD